MAAGGGSGFVIEGENFFVGECAVVDADVVNATLKEAPFGTGSHAEGGGAVLLHHVVLGFVELVMIFGDAIFKDIDPVGFRVVAGHNVNPLPRCNGFLHITAATKATAEIEGVGGNAVVAVSVIGGTAGVEIVVVHAEGPFMLFGFALPHPVHVASVLVFFEIQDFRAHPGRDGESACGDDAEGVIVRDFDVGFVTIKIAGGICIAEAVYSKGGAMVYGLGQGSWGGVVEVSAAGIVGYKPVRRDFGGDCRACENR